MDSLVGFLKVMADETRLRVVRLLMEESLNVGELVRLLGLAQSSVSRQLGVLRKAGLVREHREAGYAYYELLPPAGNAAFELLTKELKATDDASGDLARLSELQRERSDSQDRNGRFLEPGRSWAAWSRALRFVLPPLRVADFGCGDGALTAEMAAWAKSVVAVDRNGTLIERAAERIDRLGLDNVKLLHEEVERNGIRGSSQDLVTISHMLHHVVDPLAVTKQARRVLKKGGRVTVLELATHDEPWVKEKLGHVWMGFTRGELETQLREAGFASVETEPAPGKAAREPFRILIATGVVP